MLQMNTLLNYWSTNHVEYWICIVMKQTQMYVCTLEEFILVDIFTLMCKDELRYGLEFTLVYIQSLE